ncbi:MAG TPA: MotA/TolQ/ExbB proton channel family protein [Kiritimatiellia bacterium]|nr:MotA/TolQ/ExbB proton channel family protein [Kiritimatiellia bacterium]
MNKYTFMVCLLGACWSPVLNVQAQSKVDEAIRQARRDVAEASETLNRERETIAAARLPLVEEWEALQSEVSALRAEAQVRRGVRRQNERDREVRAEQLQRLENEFLYIQTVTLEYRRSLDTRLSESERMAWQRDVQAVDAALDDESRSPTVFADTASVFLSSSLDRMKTRVGGHVFDGVALDANGMELTGRMAAFGPLVYFSSSDGSRGGMVVTRFGASFPSLEENLPVVKPSVFYDLTQGKPAVIPVDVTGGDAVRVFKSRGTVLDELRKGGLVIFPLLITGALAILFSMWKFVDLRRMRRSDPDRWTQVLECVRVNDAENARAISAGAVEPLKGLFMEAVACRNATREQIEEILHEHISGYLPRLERHLGVIAVLGGIAPLLGLLGTVTGMIHTFQLVTLFGSGDAKLLSGGISEALVTTKYGLIIAVPVLLVHAYLARRARSHLAELEQTAIGMINDLKGRPAE